MNEIHGKESRAYDRYDSGEIDRETYGGLRARSQVESLEFREKMKAAQLASNDVGFETVKSILELATNAESIWNHRPMVEKCQLLEKLLSNQAFDGVNMRYEIIKPLRTLAEMTESKIWRRRVDDFITECLAVAA